MVTGLEAGAFALGVIPVIIEGIRLYKTIKRKTRILENCIEEVKILNDELLFHEQVFINECLLLLQLGAVDTQAQAMVSNTSHPLWNDRSLDSKIAQRLEGNEQAFVFAIDGILNTLQEIRDEVLALNDGVMTKREPVNISSQPKLA